MAVTASGLYYLSFRDMLGTAQLAVDLDSETTNKIALYSNSITPNFDTDKRASWRSTRSSSPPSSMRTVCRPAPWCSR